LEKTSKAQARKAKVEQWDYVKITSLGTAKKIKCEETTCRIGDNCPL
jgi:hypothetical protein